MPRLRYTPRSAQGSSALGSSATRNASRSSRPRATYASSRTVQLSLGEDDASITDAEPPTSTNMPTEVVMCIATAKGTLGCAIYEPAMSKLLLLEDTLILERRRIINRIVLQPDAQNSDVSETGTLDDKSLAAKADSRTIDGIASLLCRFSPTVVLSNSHCDAMVMATLEAELKESGAVLQLRPSTEFSAPYGSTMIHESGASIKVGRTSIDTTTSDEFALSERPISTACAGALLSYLERALQPQENHGCIPLLSVEVFHMTDAMMINRQTALSLNIFDEESHATVFSEKVREGNSLYSLLQPVQMPAAKALLRQWLSLPSLSIEVLTQRLDTVELFVNKNYLSNSEALQKSMTGLKNIHHLAQRMVSDRADLSTWRGLADFAKKAVNVLQTCRSYGVQNHHLDKVLSTIGTDSLTFVFETINAIVDWDESISKQRVCVQPGLDPELDEWRKTLANLPSILDSLADRIAGGQEHASITALKTSLEYFPQVGYVLALGRIDGMTIDDMVIRSGEGQGWTYQYSSEVKAYFKSTKTKELDQHIGDLYTLITGREIEIIQHLQTEMTTHLQAMVDCGDHFAELECLLTFARVAISNRYTRPELVEAPVLDIQDGRHPLQENLVETFIPNDTMLHGGLGMDSRKGDGVSASRASFDDVNSVLIVTGANACGKSVYLRQNALITVMAQIGSFVPARRARIGLVDRILARIQVSESVNTNQGSFKTDMNQVAEAINMSTGRSLILLDEMGKGTAPADGAALFAAVIRHFLRRAQDCPRILAATHFHEVFHDNMLGAHLPFTPAHMQVMLQDDARHTSVPVFLYKLRGGLELCSHAEQCERLCGMAQRVIDRAAYVADLSRRHELRKLRTSIVQGQADQTSIDLEDTRVLRRPGESGTLVDERCSRHDEAIARAFAAWDIETDRQCASEMGEMAWLDPAVKLSKVLHAPQVESIAVDGVLASDFSIERIDEYSHD